jgi:hypothetical protein
VRRNPELLLRLLVMLEEWPSRPGDIFVFSGHEPELAIEGFSGEQIEYHLGVLKSEGYIDCPGSQPMQGITFRSLTPAGHDLADEYRQALASEAAEKALEESRKWIPAAEALAALNPVFGTSDRARKTICTRAHVGVIRAKAQTFVVDNGKKTFNDYEVPKEFWWAEGQGALHQNWPSGDFDTWIDQKIHLQAFGVSFWRAQIEEMIPVDQLAPTAVASGQASATPVGGRPPADWWEDLIIEICFRYFRGDLKHKTQADVVRAMQVLMEERGHEAADSTVKLRARKVWNAIQKDLETGSA